MSTLSLKISAALLALSAMGAVHAAEHQVLMLNQGKDGTMVFEPGYLKVNVGDTVKFIARDKTHNAESVAVPAGATPFKGKIDEEIVVKIEKEGVYLYQCAPHVVMAMFGVIQAGKPVNLDEVKKAADELNRKAVINKERLGKYLAQVK
jgi:pseudoazurin